MRYPFGGLIFGGAYTWRGLLLEFYGICIEKVYLKCWLEEMTLVMMSLPLARVFQCSFTSLLIVFCFLLIHRNLRAQSTRSHRGIGGWWNLNSSHVVQALLPFPAPLPEYLESLLSGYCITVFSVTPITGVVVNRFKIWEHTIIFIITDTIPHFNLNRWW